MTALLPQSYMALAEAFVYPAPGRLELLQNGITALPEGTTRDRYARFVKAAGRQSLAAWEELYTRTLDLNPQVAPYIGYQIWGDSYRRGPFLARMNRALRDAGVDAGGELPDHIALILRYLAVTPAPFAALVEALIPALDRMVSTLQEAEPDNPYVDLFLAVQTFCAGLQEKETA
jgi:nitrate reductase molybdenum cofactor assembly chaperone NarJ/NarW